ncbi:MAG: tRNA (guanosine(37)-N1)-methyltransferase TrmD [Erysipelotrichaceae bacterium]
MKISVLTLFPEYFDSFKTTSIIKRALDDHLVEFETINFRDYTLDKHNNVDDTPSGGGAGMLLTCQPIIDALRSIKNEGSIVVMLTPQGRVFKQETAHKLVNYDHIILLCGHYEGFDERIRSYVDLELSIGDYVLTGGEAAAIIISDAIIRLSNNVIKKDSHEDDSHESGLLEYPQYTRPIEYEGKCIPEVLMSGHHENIRKWRLKESLRKTKKNRPDLLSIHEFTKEERKLMDEIEQEELLDAIDY